MKLSYGGLKLGLLQEITDLILLDASPHFRVETMVADDTIITGNASIPVKQSEVFYWIRFPRQWKFMFSTRRNVPCKRYKV
jgi:hypothetical protein